MKKPVSGRTLNRALWGYLWWCLGIAVVLLLPWWGAWGYSPLATWLRSARRSEDASHVLLVLPIVVYLVWQKWRELPEPTRGRILAPVLLCVGVLGLVIGMGSAAFDTDDILEPHRLADGMRDEADPLSRYVQGRLSPVAVVALGKERIGPNNLRVALVDDLNALVAGPPLYEPYRFAGKQLRETTQQWILRSPQGEELAWLNRRLLEDAYPEALRRAGGVLGDGGPMWFGLPSTTLTLALGSNARPFLAGCAIFLGLLAGGWRVFGPGVMRALLFPVAFLAFVMPLPSVVLGPVNTFLQFWTAEASYWMLRLTGFRLPVPVDNVLLVQGMAPMVVAEECSGARSSMVLLMVGLLGAHLLLRQTWRRVVLVLSSIPIGILRNGLRVWILAILELKFDLPVSSGDNWFHQHGGQPMFVLSLIPLFALLLWLRRGERAKPGTAKE